jgi:hypothetical protein
MIQALSKQSYLLGYLPDPDDGAVPFCKTSVHFSWTTWHTIPQDNTLIAFVSGSCEKKKKSEGSYHYSKKVKLSL